MQKWIGVLLLVVYVSGSAVAQSSYAEHVNAYVTKYKEMAMIEQQRSGVPASITLGQGVLETQAGQSMLCTDANNHFGIKCKKEWTGETIAHDDDAKGECFRKYGTAQNSYKDHSDYLLNSPRYAALFKLKKTDYKGWAHGLKKCGYATNPVYAFQLIKIIEDFELQSYTVAAIKSANASPKLAAAEVVPDQDATAKEQQADPSVAKNEAKTNPYTIQQVNGLHAFYARKGDVLLEHAIKNNIRYAKLLELNDLPDAPLEADMPVYLVKKHTQGKRKMHTVLDGESMLQIAQTEGMSLKQLRAFNHLPAGTQPVAGTMLYLQTTAPTKPELLAANANTEAKAQPATTTSADDYIVKTKPETSADEKIEIPAPIAEEKIEAAPVTIQEQPVPVNEVKATPEHINPVLARLAEQAPATGTKTEKSGYTITLDTSAATVAAAAITPPAVITEQPAAKAPEKIPVETRVDDAPVTVAEQPNPEPEPVVVKKAEPVYNIPDRAAANSEPQDEFAKLRAKMDKVVYAVPQQQTTKTNSTKNPDVKANETGPVPQATTDNGEKFYVVKKGDTGFSIAKKHHITMKQLRDWNKLDFEAIAVGKKLQVRP